MPGVSPADRLSSPGRNNHVFDLSVLGQARESILDESCKEVTEWVHRIVLVRRDEREKEGELR